MSDKKNVIIAILIFILFFLLFPLKLVPNINFISNQSTNLDGDIKPISDKKIPFIYKDRAGYFSTDLKESWGMDISDGITLLSNSYINSTRGLDIIKVIDFEGETKYAIEDSGHPFSIEDRLFVISRDRKSLSEIVHGEKKWTKVFNYIITSIDANKNSVVLGFVKGFFMVLDSEGEIFFSYEPGGSRVSIIYSVAISEDDRYVAIISGLDPQRFILYEKRETEYKPLYAINLKEEIRKSMNIFITQDNNFVFIEGLYGYYIVNINTQSSIFTESNFSLQDVQYMPELDIYMVHSGAVNYHDIKLLTPDNRILLEKNFVAESVSVSTLDHSMYIVVDNSVLKLDIKD